MPRTYKCKTNHGLVSHDAMEESQTCAEWHEPGRLLRIKEFPGLHCRGM